MKKRNKITLALVAALMAISFSGCAVKDAYFSIENFFVNTYTSVENFFVDTYTSVEDFFVESFFLKDGETLEEAKDRLNNNR
jgi:hypothetical protein